MRRVVITGMGIVSCLGNDKETVSANLRASRSGIRFNQAYADMGLRSQVSGSVDLDLEALIDRKVYRFMVMPPPSPTCRWNRPSRMPA